MKRRRGLSINDLAAHGPGLRRQTPSNDASRRSPPPWNRHPKSEAPAPGAGARRDAHPGSGKRMSMTDHVSARLELEDGLVLCTGGHIYAIAPATLTATDQLGELYPITGQEGEAS